MSVNTENSWYEEFGLKKNNNRLFFTNIDEIGVCLQGSYSIRHAFDLLDLDGVFCLEDRALIYFKFVEKISDTEIVQWQKKIWNLSGDPILVLISRKHVYVISGMSRPIGEGFGKEKSPALIETLDRVSEELQQFILSVESGEYFRAKSRFFNPKSRVDHDLLENLQGTRKLLTESVHREDKEGILDTLDASMSFGFYVLPI